MSVLKKKETLTANICYMALMASINVIFILIVRFIPILQILLLFILPLTNAIVTLCCKKRYFPIYAIVTVLLCVLVAWNIMDALFYIIPSIFSGFAFALLLEKKVDNIFIIYISTIINVIFTYISIPIINFFFKVDFIYNFAYVFKLHEFKYLNILTPMFIFFISLVQSTFAYAVIKEELNKLEINLDEGKKDHDLIILLVTLISILLSIGFIYIDKGQFAYLFMMSALYFTVFIFIKLIMNKKKWIIISLISSFFLSLFLFAILYQYIKAPFGFISINIFLFFVGIIGFSNNYLLTRKKKDTIKSEEEKNG